MIVENQTPSAHIVPKVGMGVTYLCGSDRYPYTIIKVNTSRKLTIQEDETARHQFIAINAGNTPVKKIKEIRLHKSGGWYDATGMRYAVGYRESYLDPSF